MLLNLHETLTESMYFKNFSHNFNRKDEKHLPKFPEKKWFGNTNPDFVEKRRKDLELYINKLLKIEFV